MGIGGASGRHDRGELEDAKHVAPAFLPDGCVRTSRTVLRASLAEDVARASSESRLRTRLMRHAAGTGITVRGGHSNTPSHDHDESRNEIEEWHNSRETCVPQRGPLARVQGVRLPLNTSEARSVACRHEAGRRTSCSRRNRPVLTAAPPSFLQKPELQTYALACGVCGVCGAWLFKGEKPQCCLPARSRCHTCACRLQRAWRLSHARGMHGHVRLFWRMSMSMSMSMPCACACMAIASP